MNRESLANNLKQLRKKKGFSQQELAALSQLSLRTVQRIEKGETEPIGHTLTQLANALEVSPEQLQNDDTSNKSPIFIIRTKKFLQIVLIITLTLLGFVIVEILDDATSKERMTTITLQLISLIITSSWLTYVVYYRKS